MYCFKGPEPARTGVTQIYSCEFFFDDFLTSSWNPHFSGFGANLAPTWPPTWPQVGPSWLNLAQLGPNLALLSSILALLGSILGTSWPQVGPKLVPSWSFCKSSCLLDAILPTCQKLHKNQWFFNDFGGFQPSRWAYLAPNLHIFGPTWTNLGQLKPT